MDKKGPARRAVLYTLFPTHVAGNEPFVEVPIRRLGIFHICNVWILMRRIVIYLVGRNFYILILKLTEPTSTQVGICLIIPRFFNIQTIEPWN